MRKKKIKHLKQKHYNLAVKLAKRTYNIFVEPDITVSTGQISYIATNPELRGLLAGGDTPFEAITHLNDARIDWIWACIDEGIDIPEPTNDYLKG